MSKLYNKRVKKKNDLDVSPKKSKSDNTRVAPVKTRKPDFRFGSEDRKNIEKHTDLRQRKSVEGKGWSYGTKSHRRDVKKELGDDGRVLTWGDKKTKTQVYKKKGLDKYPIYRKKKK
jgi:hypothetical protein